MFSSTKSIQRGKCACCPQLITETVKLFVLDIKDTDMKSFNFVPSLVESDADFAACLKCWKLIGEYIHARVRVTEYV